MFHTNYLLSKYNYTCTTMHVPQCVRSGELNNTIKEEVRAIACTFLFIWCLIDQLIILFFIHAVCKMWVCRIKFPRPHIPFNGGKTNHSIYCQSWRHWNKGICITHVHRFFLDNDVYTNQWINKKIIWAEMQTLNVSISLNIYTCICAKHTKSVLGCPF